MLGFAGGCEPTGTCFLGRDGAPLAFAHSFFGEGAHRAKEAEREGEEHPYEEHYDDGAEGDSGQGVVGNGDGVEHAGDAKAHKGEQVGCQEHGGNPGIAFIPGIEAAAAQYPPQNLSGPTRPICTYSSQQGLRLPHSIALRASRAQT